MSGVSVPELKEFLSNKDAAELKKEIVELFKLFPDVKNYYTAKVNPVNEKDVMETFKKTIRNEFFPDRGYGRLRFAITRKALNDFRKIAKLPENIAELMVSYVEYGVKFTNTYGDIDERFYNNMVSMYEKAVKYIVQNNLVDIFIKRLEKIVAETSGIGWGFHDDLWYIFGEYLSE